MIKRYELSDEQWSKIAALVPGKIGDLERTGSDNRLFLNGCLWVLRSGAHWRNLPERYGKWKTVHKRFSRWCHAGITISTVLNRRSAKLESLASLTVGWNQTKRILRRYNALPKDSFPLFLKEYEFRFNVQSNSEQIKLLKKWKRKHSI